jgi:GAF domain-containing protein
VSEEQRGRGGRGQPSKHNTGTMAGQDQLAGDLSDLARQLQQLETPEAVLDEMVQAAIALIPGTDQGSITDVIARRRIKHKAASSDLAERVDRLMIEVGQGPCLDVVWEQQTVRVDDLATETRWPLFSQRAVELGARGMLSFQLYVEQDTLGALNLYSSEPGAFTDESEHIGLLFAAHAAIAYAGAQRAGHLEAAIHSRGTISTAVGILIERYRLDRLRAFAALTRWSQHSNRKLHVIAEELVLETEAATKPATKADSQQRIRTV